MPAINIRKEFYDEIIHRGKDVTEYVNKVVETALDEKKEGKK